ncbi:PEP/pyruvate-binding domain-containing protein [Tuwongella immobilis]|uniref:Pyruvate phosphate dikinase AMP/ATP-binding domain-containing protein n=1 Tax=Tuwongella immobilis TaxID=692036 RepID=A0A6C2YQ72_9BACT|nr:PEP/pyruvate-binding domain-containing protein [Tuwongella immobilis]VIP03780.1 pyruvate phosphate dikinase pep pyruvate-binding protein : Pyruvate phosphate dikinase PEP/pyruvate-binding protein OS=Rhodopirellula sp. SWK7 GN=RRSWK_04808 PE=4 SV=1: PPDK_N: PEP-utilizers [Tuwongella immobilis]VTS04928.1 pyruvate phosphate dikinase pep pyruvate-binding protein : Pyruvate phosphate dikinase PEP/pyruvate-binding protein OS=Rhodopirellula sp. SWK7 GN=RRSWK_04808 PE=4 SV=1: PPDK_N: PEP-utilizers [Tu
MIAQPNVCWLLDELAATNRDFVGGKTVSLARMRQAGLPVPDAFCIPTSVYRQYAGQPLAEVSDFVAAVAVAYASLGGGPVAVRSSAVAEDGDAASFAGQQQSFLGVEGASAVVAAIDACWQSLFSDRAQAYRHRQATGDAVPAMAVIVQRMIPADVAGVMFTRDPFQSREPLLRIESAWGVGEAVVSGKVTPDCLVIHRETGSIHDQRAGGQQVAWSAEGFRPLPAERRGQFSLTESQIQRLIQLAAQLESLFGDACDIEWAFQGDQLWLLQSRPITTIPRVELRELRQREIQRVTQLAEPTGTVWARIELTEVLLEPTEMSWDVAQRLMGANGGLGMMNRDFGGRPDPNLGGTSAYDRIGGRVYCNLSRLPRLQFTHPPLVYPLARYARNPAEALDPKPIFAPFRDGWRSWLRLPGQLRQLRRSQIRLEQEMLSFERRFRDEVLLVFRESMLLSAYQSLEDWSDAVWLARFETLVKQVCVDFARESLKATVLAQKCLQDLDAVLARQIDDPDARSQLFGELIQAAHPEPGANLARAMTLLLAGSLSVDQFLTQFGHRGPSEMELSTPRWSEQPEAIEALVSALPRSESHEAIAESDELPEWTPPAEIVRLKLEEPARRLIQMIALRELGKHELMRGYAEIRRFLLEWDRRHRLNGLTFHLTMSELASVAKSAELRWQARIRRVEREAWLRMPMPPVVFSTRLDEIGRSDEWASDSGDARSEDRLIGIRISPGVAEGIAWVRREPSLDGMPDGPFVLVCPSTDPAWVPLFAKAVAVVLESGGVLSHGAIVAREFGIPAVGGLPDITSKLTSGTMLRVDGDRGVVHVLQRSAPT